MVCSCFFLGMGLGSYQFCPLPSSTLIPFDSLKNYGHMGSQREGVWKFTESFSASLEILIPMSSRKKAEWQRA